MKNVKRYWLWLGLAVFVLSPFLVCDLQPTATYYLVSLDYGPQKSTPAPLHYDLVGIAWGHHHIEAEACNEAGCSAPASLNFNKAAPADVTGVSIGR